MILEQLEPRDCLSPVNPVVSIVGVGVDPQAFVPMVNVMIGDNSTLLDQAGYNVGHGTLGGLVSQPGSGGTLTEQQIDALIGQQIAAGNLPAGPNALMLVFLDRPPTNAPANSAAYHDGFTWQGHEIATAWTWTQPWESIPAFHEFDEATARMAGATFEICDEVNWQAEPDAGFNISNFVRPDGTPDFAPQAYIGTPFDLGPVSPPTPPTPPVTPPVVTPTPAEELAAIPLEEFRALAYSILAEFDPHDFAASAAQAQAELAANPMLSTPEGQQAQLVGALALAEALRSR